MKSIFGNVFRKISPILNTGDFVVQKLTKSLVRQNHSLALCVSKVIPEVKHQLYTDPLFVRTPFILERYIECLDFHLDDSGDNFRPVNFLTMYELLTENKSLSEDEKRKIPILACCIELYQASVLAHDDIADKGMIREGEISWFKRCDQQLLTIYDTSMLYTSAHKLLDSHFKGHEDFVRINVLFDDSIFRHTWAQILDMASAKDYRGNIVNEYTTKIRDRIGANKSVIFIALPIKLAMIAAKLLDQQEIQKIDGICTSLGLAWTAWASSCDILMQDDYIDCYLDPYQRERTHNDIEEGKCSWLVVKAIQKANESQKKIFNESYGRTDAEHVQAIKDIFDDLKLHGDFEQYKRDLFKTINTELETLSNSKIRKLLAKVSSDSEKRMSYSSC